MSDKEDRGYVEGGMELLSWRYDPEEWNDYVFDGILRRSREDEAQSWLGVLVTMGAGGSLLAAVVAGFFASWTATGVLAGLALVLALMLVRNTPRAETESVSSDNEPPRVLFTTTGVIFGQEVRRWRDEEYRLAFVLFDPSPDPTLVLEFDGELRTAAWRIAIPRGLEADVEDLAMVLQAKTLEDAGIEKPFADERTLEGH